MDLLRFLVRGSAQDPYKVTFKKEGNNLSAYCTCPAGDNGQYCKHRLNILGGIPEGILSGNEQDVKIVASWLPGTDVEAALNSVIEAEEQFEKTKREYSLAKKRLAAALRD